MDSLLRLTVTCASLALFGCNSLGAPKPHHLDAVSSHDGAGSGRGGAAGSAGQVVDSGADRAPGDQDASSAAALDSSVADAGRDASALVQSDSGADAAEERASDAATSADAAVSGPEDAGQDAATADAGTPDAGHPVCACKSGPCCDGCNFRPSSYYCGDTVRYTTCIASWSPGIVLKCSGSTGAIEEDHWNLFCSGHGTQCTRWGAHTMDVDKQCVTGTECLGAAPGRPAPACVACP